MAIFSKMVVFVLAFCMLQGLWAASALACCTGDVPEKKTAPSVQNIALQTSLQAAGLHCHGQEAFAEKQGCQHCDCAQSHGAALLLNGPLPTQFVPALAMPVSQGLVASAAVQAVLPPPKIIL